MVVSLLAITMGEAITSITIGIMVTPAGTPLSVAVIIILLYPMLFVEPIN
jgi:hypothetical protein